jgi:hypothetical protein
VETPAAGGAGARGAGKAPPPAPVAAEPDAPSEDDPASNFRRGLALIDGETSYSSRAVDQALDEALELGIGPNAVSLTVFGSGEEPLPPACALAPPAVYGSASDLSLASASAAARAREMSVLLALEVLSWPSGAWADNISWTDPADTQAFFARYGRVALHYALLAELLDLESFSFGANLREVSRTDPKTAVRDPALFEQRRVGWRSLIRRLHAAYDGMLTYAFRFPVEGHESDFVEDLDAVGVSLYPRLAAPEREPSDEEIRRSLRFELQQALDLAVRWNRPLLVVQLGFPARDDSWSAPTLPRGAFDPSAQLRFFDALADVLASRLDNAAALRGYFLWNWPIDSRAGSQGGFSLRGQPAESALRRLFER